MNDIKSFLEKVSGLLRNNKLAIFMEIAVVLFPFIFAHWAANFISVLMTVVIPLITL